MRRRTMLGLLAAGTLSFALDACAPTRPAALPVPTLTAPAASPSVTPTPVITPTPSPTPTPPPPLTFSAPSLAKVPIPGGVLDDLPGDGNLMAWTVDDGTDAEVIRRYVEFARSSGVRLTFFVTGCYDGWDANAELLRPFVQSGQIQLANHTWSHPDLTSLSDDDVLAELQRTHDYLQGTFGVDARPFFRPPFGFHDDRVDALAASIGYSTPVLWYGSLSDSGLESDQQVIDFATQWFLPEHVVIGHLNFLPVTEVFPQLEQLLVDRGLTPVTLNDVFSH